MRRFFFPRQYISCVSMNISPCTTCQRLPVVARQWCTLCRNSALKIDRAYLLSILTRLACFTFVDPFIFWILSRLYSKPFLLVFAETQFNRIVSIVSFFFKKKRFMRLRFEGTKPLLTELIGNQPVYETCPKLESWQFQPPLTKLFRRWSSLECLCRPTAKWCCTRPSIPTRPSTAYSSPPLLKISTFEKERRRRAPMTTTTPALTTTMTPNRHRGKPRWPLSTSPTLFHYSTRLEVTCVELDDLGWAIL